MCAEPIILSLLVLYSLPDRNHQHGFWCCLVLISSTAHHWPYPWALSRSPLYGFVSIRTLAQLSALWSGHGQSQGQTGSLPVSLPIWISDCTIAQCLQLLNASMSALFLRAQGNRACPGQRCE